MEEHDLFKLHRLATSNRGNFMFINEFGSKGAPFVLLPDLMPVSGEDLYQCKSIEGDKKWDCLRLL
jgi:hypothetical protein